MLTRIAIRQRSNAIVLDSRLRLEGTVACRLASSFGHWSPHLHCSLLPVRPCVVRNQCQRNFAALQLFAVVSGIQPVAGCGVIVGDSSMAKHYDSTQKVALE